MHFQSINPYSGELLAAYAQTSPAQLEQILQNARSAYRGWSREQLAKRLELLPKLAALLLERKTALAALITAEMGKPIAQALAEVEKCAWVCRHYAQHAEVYLQPKPIATEARASYVEYQPLGVILLVMPWNFPFWQVFRQVAPCVAAGNVCLLKHAPNVSGCAEAIAGLFRDLGAETLCQSVFLDNEQVAALIADERLAGVALTGSNRAGAAIGAQAGRHIKPCVLELGGSDAFIVLADADLERAAQVGIQSRMLNTGQTCISAKRFLVEKSVAADFLDLLRQKMDALTWGDPMQAGFDLGTMARLDLATQLEAQIEQSLHSGATAIRRGGRVGESLFFAPALLTDIPRQAAAAREELFGPVLGLWVVDGDAQAAQLANDTIFGLGASVWSEDLERAERLARELEVGCVSINELVKSDPRLEFGGVKQSGFGRELGEAGILAFCNAKSVWVR